MRSTFCRLTRPGLKIPMPGESRLFSERGETVDAENPFWARCLKDKDIKEAAEPAAKSNVRKAGEKPAPAKAPPDGANAV